MRSLAAIAVILFSFIFASAQNEQAPLLEKDIAYKNWTLKDVRTGEDRELRKMIAGKKLVMVIYYAPWCGNWKYDLRFLNRFYEKYKGDGLEIIGVGHYDPLATMKSNLEEYKIAFPLVYASESRGDRLNTDHYKYRTQTGDTRKWGSPWYIFIEPAKVPAKGDTLTTKTHIINGEMIENEGEKFIRTKLGLPEVDTKAAVSSNEKIEVCDPARPSTELKKP
ncbi:MAG TPA: redoxin domain-containing protein [Pyrinomonadaceae bacterium]|nr:redoxin domain-containing protein [Pyrinomonadaceae bacterium]